MKKVIERHVELYVDDVFDPVWSYLKSRLGGAEVRRLKKENHHSDADYRDDYRKRILRSEPFPVYPYLPRPKIALNQQNQSVPKTKNHSKILYLAGWKTLANKTISSEADVVIHLQNLPEHEPKGMKYKVAFEQATYIFVATLELKEFILTTFDINPYKIILLKVNLHQNLPKPQQVSNRQYLFIRGDFFEGQITLEQLVKNFSTTYKFIFIVDLERFRKMNLIVGEGLFLQELEAEMWHKLHTEGQVYRLNLNTNELKPCRFEDFEVLNLGFMYENLTYYLGRMLN